jgi:transcriptional regulator with XRE-family HTH domain
MGVEKDSAYLVAFGNRVKELRLAKGLSMRAMADSLNMDVMHLSKIESAKMNTTIGTARAISKVLEIPTAELFNFDA